MSKNFVLLFEEKEGSNLLGYLLNDFTGINASTLTCKDSNADYAVYFCRLIGRFRYQFVLNRNAVGVTS